MHLQSPIWLVAMVPVILLLVGYILRGRSLGPRTPPPAADPPPGELWSTPTLANPSPARTADVPPAPPAPQAASVGPAGPLPGFRRHLTVGLLVLGLLALCFGLTRPELISESSTSEATEVVVAIDVSNSMGEKDVPPTRLAAAQQAATTFIGLLSAQAEVALVTFSSTAKLVVQPTTDRVQVQNAISSLKLTYGTAIGEAIDASVQALTGSGSSGDSTDLAPPGPRLVVLLSDGANTTGRSVASAIAEATSADIPIATIALGTKDSPEPADVDALSTIATQTGGSFHTATSVAELTDVYRHISAEIPHTHHRGIAWIPDLAGLILLGLGTATLIGRSRLI